jgi:hypothetical protein
VHKAAIENAVLCCFNILIAAVLVDRKKIYQLLRTSKGDMARE